MRRDHHVEIAEPLEIRSRAVAEGALRVLAIFGTGIDAESLGAAQRIEQVAAAAPEMENRIRRIDEVLEDPLVRNGGELVIAIFEVLVEFLRHAGFAHDALPVGTRMPVGASDEPGPTAIGGQRLSGRNCGACRTYALSPKQTNFD